MRRDIALGIIDSQCGFMPASEGERLGQPGFGELGVPEGDEIIAPLNMVLGSAALQRAEVFTTQDWHPRETAHFSEEPNFTTTWPVHCVAYTPGARIHPDLQQPKFTAHFYKGETALQDGAEDTSYSGFNSMNTAGEMLPHWLKRQGTRTVALGGLALDYCVGMTALDLRQQLGLNVWLIGDATRPVAPDSGAAMLTRLEAAGVKVMTAKELLVQLEEV